MNRVLIQEGQELWKASGRMGGKGGVGAGGRNDPLYAHMNNKKIKKKTQHGTGTKTDMKTSGTE
jgi:hypothetical protein